MRWDLCGGLTLERRALSDKAGPTNEGPRLEERGSVTGSVGFRCGQCCSVAVLRWVPLRGEKIRDGNGTGNGSGGEGTKGSTWIDDADVAHNPADCVRQRQRRHRHKAAVKRREREDTVVLLTRTSHKERQLVQQPDRPQHSLLSSSSSSQAAETRRAAEQPDAVARSSLLRRLGGLGRQQNLCYVLYVLPTPCRSPQRPPRPFHPPTAVPATGTQSTC